MNSKDPVILKIAYYFMILIWNLYLMYLVINDYESLRNKDTNSPLMFTVLFTIVIILTLRKLLITNDNDISDFKQIKKYLKAKIN
jgi:hypothetical protein